MKQIEANGKLNDWCCQKDFLCGKCCFRRFTFCLNGNLKPYTYIENPFSICCFMYWFTTAYDLPELGVPNTILARNGFTTLIQPFHTFFLCQNFFGRFTEYSLWSKRVFCINNTFPVLKTSSVRLLLSNRLIHSPAINRQI
jgi:hypothetical protein